MHKKQQKWTITIPDFISHIKLSEKTRAKYYKQHENIPKKYCKDGIVFSKEGHACNAKTGEKIVKNWKKAGTPNMMKINGQDLWSGLNPFTRNKMAEQLHNFYAKYVKEQLIDKGVTKIPLDNTKRLVILFTLFDPEFENLDNDNNEYILKKTFLDTITRQNKNKKEHKKLGLIPDDSRKYVLTAPFVSYKGEKREMVIDMILVNSDYKLEI